jgi:hypothetical protein
MRKLGMVLAGLGGFLVMLAILAKFYAPGQLMRTPIDVDSVTRASGEAALGTDPAEPVLGTQITRADSEKSDDDVVSFVSSSCLVFDRGEVPECVSADDPDQRLITASVEYFATDRVTAEAVNDPKYLPATAEPVEGLQNKWPFDVEKKTYGYWDDTAGGVFPAEFEDTEEIDGVETYRFHQVITDAPIEVTDGVSGTYSTDKTIWVEPVTGSIVNQSYHQVRETDEGDNFITLDLAFTPEEVQESIDDARTNRDQIKLIRSIVPLVGFVVGIPVLLIGLFLTARDGAGKRKATSSDKTAGSSAKV